MLRKLRRRHTEPVVLPDHVFVAVYDGPAGEELLAYANRGRTYFVGSTTPDESSAYWRERGATGFRIVEKETVDLLEIVTNAADGLVIDPLSENGVGLDRRDVREWLANPKIAFDDSG
jgi:hypothetical protein